MHHSQPDSELLDRYFDALLVDPAALPPAELDAETVRLLRALVETRYRDTPDSPETLESTQSRVWSRVMFAACAPAELEPTYQPARPRRAPAAIVGSPSRKPGRADVPFLVAAVFALVCLTGLFIQHTDALNDNLARYRVEEYQPDAYTRVRFRVKPGLNELEMLPQDTVTVVEMPQLIRNRPTFNRISD